MSCILLALPKYFCWFVLFWSLLFQIEYLNGYYKVHIQWRRHVIWDRRGHFQLVINKLETKNFTAWLKLLFYQSFIASDGLTSTKNGVVCRASRYRYYISLIHSLCAVSYNYTRNICHILIKLDTTATFYFGFLMIRRSSIFFFFLI